MRLICPACGAVASAEAWQRCAQGEEIVSVVSTLPQSIGRQVYAYMGLFRPKSGRGLSGAKELRLIVELRDLVAAPTIQWDRRPARPNSVAAWAGAMERMIHQPPRRLPLTSHGYLRAIAYESADEADRAAERRQVQAERSGAARAQREGTEEAVGVGEVIDREWMRQIRQRRLKVEG